MNNLEEQLKKDIRALFLDLVKEEDERFDKPTKRKVYPQNHVYVYKAKELYKKALELEKINSKYSTYELKDVIDDEVGLVDRHHYEYEKNSLIPKAKSVAELQNLMHNASYHIKLYFYDVLEDIDID